MDQRLLEQWLKARPRLASDVVARRVVLRGSPLFVLQDPATGRHWRTSVELYRLAHLLDGSRTIAEAMLVSGLSDETPERATLLKGLADMAAAGLLRMPGMRRSAAEQPTSVWLRGLLQRVVFMRWPMGNLQPVLPLALRLLGGLYSIAGSLIVLGLVIAAGWVLLGETTAIFAQLDRLSQLDARGLLIGWLIFVAAKMLHEIGHAVAAARAGAAEGLELRSFRWGISFMFFFPAPYVDVSSAWLIASRWRRAQVGLAGIQIDLLLASIAGLLWANIAGGFVADRLFELMLLCGVSSLLFNANPLVRLDGYYVVSDLLEIPNLQSKSWQALRALLLWPLGLAERPTQPSQYAYALYSAASWIWRWSVFIAIFWLAGGISANLAYAFAITIGCIYVVIPMARLLATPRAISSALASRRILAAPVFAAGLAAVLFWVPIPVHIVAEGVAWNEALAWVYAPANGVVRSVAPVGARQGTLIEVDNPELRMTLAQLKAEGDALAVQARRARAETLHKADSLAERQRAVHSQIGAIEEEMAKWKTQAGADAVWHPLRAEHLEAAWIRRDDQRPLGVSVGEGPTVLRIVFDQWDGPAALQAMAGLGKSEIEIRRRGETAPSMRATVIQLPNQARGELPSQALSTAAGGQIPVKADARGQPKPTEAVFEARLALAGAVPAPPLRHGERVEALIKLDDSSLASLGWKRLRQLLQRRLSA